VNRSRGNTSNKKLARIGKSAARGLVAGAAGTVALDAATYADMVPRGRPSSEVPAQTVERLAERIGAQGIAGCLRCRGSPLQARCCS
jgi:hypothetical protein